MRATLTNLRCLLKPGGVFQIAETVIQDPRLTFVFGTLEGYWQYEDLDCRSNHATMAPGKWEEVLKEVGCDKVVCSPMYNSVHGLITARVSLNESDMTATSPLLRGSSQYSWLIFYHDLTAGTSKMLKEKLTRMNRKVHMVKRPSICEEASINVLVKNIFATMEEGKLEGIIYLWGLSNGIHNRDQSQISLPLINLLQAMLEFRSPPRLYVVTRETSYVEGTEVTDPAAATLHGIIKSLTNETMELHLSCLDLSADDTLIDQVDHIFYDLWVSGKGNRNIAFRNGNRLCSKMVAAKVSNLEPLTLPSGCDRFRLLLPSTKLMADLDFGSLQHYNLEDNEVEVQVKAMALNFRDVFAVLKPIAQFEDLNTVGMDFAGVVTKVGPKVTSRRVGDRVIGMNMNNNLSLPTHIKMEEQFVVSLPISFTYEEGATLPAVFSTVVHCLINIAGMKQGETVLIHTATGGVGLCAIQLAKRIGVDVIATAGNKRKQNYLRNMGIKHVFHSRTTDFGKQILKATNGRGVDIVLNSITGEGLKEASLSALANNGRFIEMSKLNVWKPEEVKELRPDVFYEIADVSNLDTTEMEKLIGQLNHQINEGIRPIPYERFDAVNIRGALSYLQKAKHIGKIVCVMPEVKIENSKITVTTPLFNEFSTYLVTGGLGGIGLEVVKWMLKSGAKHIAIASRSSPKADITNQLESWKRFGNHVEAFSVDIGDRDQCEHLFKKLNSSGMGFPPLRGVMHAAGVIDDAIIENQNWNKFHCTYNPKVNGTWNLHDFTKDLPLEHFVVFSSIASLIGTPSQTNHAASNNFEDSLVAFRRSNGLPGTSVNWGNWGEVGVAKEFDFPGVRPLTTSQGILALETFLKTQDTNMGVANFESFDLSLKIFPGLKHFLDDKRLFAATKKAVTINSDEFWRDVDSAECREGKMVVFKNLIKSTVKTILKMDHDEVIDDMTDFQTLGVDSLMMLEMKNALQSILGSRITLSANQLKDCTNTETLANQFLIIMEGEGSIFKPTLPSIEELQMLVREDSNLPDHIRPSERTVACELSQIKRVLLTGVTGSLGPYLLRELTNRPKIQKIICLIRKIGNVTPSQRLLKQLRDVNLHDQVDMSKVECIQGDIIDDKFGLPKKEYDSLATNVDCVINSAVRADHTGKYYKAPEGSKTDLRTVNVKGTIRILEFAVHNKLKHVFQGSTILSVVNIDDDEEKGDDCYVLDDNDKACPAEKWQDVDAFDQLPYNLGYPLSKHVSEQLCRQAIERGVPCKTFRLPIIGGDGKTGRSNYRGNHVILRWLTYMKLQCMPDMPMPMMVISVDDCAHISLDVFFNPAAPFDVYNIIHPGKSVDQIMITIAEEYGIPIKMVPMHDFIDKVKEVGDESPLAPFMKLYRDDEEELFELLEQNSTAKGMLKSAKENEYFFKSGKLAQLYENYDTLESTEVVMRRDIRYLKESGVFQKFGINTNKHR